MQEDTHGQESFAARRTPRRAGSGRVKAFSLKERSLLENSMGTDIRSQSLCDDAETPTCRISSSRFSRLDPVLC